MCTNYLCCGADDGFPTETERQAKEWGSYLCDMPPKTLKLMFEYIRDVVKPDVVVWTGDNSAHKIWDNTPDEVIDSTHNITKIMREVLDKSSITVIPIHGNHDYWPANTQDMTKAFNSTYVAEYGKMWKEAGWLNDEDLKIFNKYGYYSKTLTLKDGRAFN